MEENREIRAKQGKPIDHLIDSEHLGRLWCKPLRVKSIYSQTEEAATNV